MSHRPSIAERGYVALLWGARLLSPLAARGGSKAARGVRGRRGVVEGMEAWAGEGRRPDRPLVWFHAPSVGEGLQARAVLEALQARRPDVQTAFTHFSPSAEGLAGRMPIDWAGYLPWDLPGDAGRAVGALRPDLLVFTKTEVWPTLTRVAAEAGVRLALAAATLPEGSSRLKRGARLFLGPAMGRLDAVLAIAEEDAARFRELGAAPGAVEVTGDPGIDSAAQRAGAADPAAPWLAPLLREAAPTVVAGSTWPPDEAVLVEAATRARERVPGLRLVVAPHEPEPAHLEALEGRLRRGGWTPARLGAVERAGSLGAADAVVVDRVGVLAHLYTAGTAAYVGGGFHDEGLHSVLEPAAAGLPVAFGSRHGNARAAGDLVRVGAGRVVRNAAELAEALQAWLTDASARGASARAATDYIEGHRGAADQTAERLLALLERR